MPGPLSAVPRGLGGGVAAHPQPDCDGWGGSLGVAGHPAQGRRRGLHREFFTSELPVALDVSLAL